MAKDSKINSLKAENIINKIGNRLIFHSEIGIMLV